MTALKSIPVEANNLGFISTNCGEHEPKIRIYNHRMPLNMIFKKVSESFKNITVQYASTSQA